MGPALSCHQRSQPLGPQRPPTSPPPGKELGGWPRFSPWPLLRGRGAPQMAFTWALGVPGSGAEDSGSGTAQALAPSCTHYCPQGLGWNLAALWVSGGLWRGPSAWSSHFPSQKGAGEQGAGQFGEGVTGWPTGSKRPSLGFHTHLPRSLCYFRAPPYPTWLAGWLADHRAAGPEQWQWGGGEVVVSIPWNCRAFCWILEPREAAESLSAVGAVKWRGTPGSGE